VPPPYAEQDLADFSSVGIDKVVIRIPYNEDRSTDIWLTDRSVEVPIGKRMPLVLAYGTPTLEIAEDLNLQVHIQQRHAPHTKSKYAVIRSAQRSMTVAFNPSTLLAPHRQPASVEDARNVLLLLLAHLSGTSVEPACAWRDIPLIRLDLTRDFQVTGTARYIEGLARLRRSYASRNHLWLNSRTGAPESFYAGGSKEHSAVYDKDAEQGVPPGRWRRLRWEQQLTGDYLSRCMKHLPEPLRLPSLGLLGVPSISADDVLRGGSAEAVAQFNAGLELAEENVALIARERWLHSRYYHWVATPSVVARRARQVIPDERHRLAFLAYLRAKHSHGAVALQGEKRDRYEAWEALTGAPWGSPFGPPEMAGSAWRLVMSTGTEEVTRYPGVLTARATPFS
jgi:hypothetical protein